MTDVSVQLQVKAEIKKAIAELRTVRKELGNTGKGSKKAARDFSDLNKRTTEMEKGMQGVSKAGRTLRNVLASIGVGLSFKAVLDATIAQENALRQVEARIQSTGGAAGFTTKELQAMAGGFQAVTTFGDEAVLAMQGVLLMFTNIRGDEFAGATQAILNMSAAMGTDLNSAARMVGKSLDDPIKGVSQLAEAGVTFTEQQKAMVKSLVETGDAAGAQRIMLEALEVRYGGAAAAARDTFGGAMEALKNAFGDLLEADGEGMVDAKVAIEDLVALLSDPNTVEALNAFAAGTITAFSKLAGLVGVFVNVGEGIGEFVAAIVHGVNPLEVAEGRVQNLTHQIEQLDQSLARLPKGSNENLRAFRDSLAKELEVAQADLERFGLGMAKATDPVEMSAAEEARQNKAREHATNVTQIKQQETAAIRREMEAQVKLYDAANKDLEKAQKEREELDKRAKELREEFATPPKEAESSAQNIVRIYDGLPKALEALKGGNFEEASKGAELLEERLRKAREVGSMSTAEMRRLADQVGKIWEGIGAGKEKAAQDSIQAVQKTIEDLAAKAAALRELQVGFDEAAAATSAETLRTMLEQKLAANPIQIPVEMILSGENKSDKRVTDLLKDTVPGFADGGRVRGRGTGRSDSILARVSNNEFILPADAVRYYGTGLLEQLRSKALPRFADGGLVGDSLVNNLQLPPAPDVPLPGGLSGQPVIIHLPGGEVVQLAGERDEVQALQRAFSREALKRGRRT